MVNDKMRTIGKKGKFTDFECFRTEKKVIKCKLASENVECGVVDEGPFLRWFLGMTWAEHGVFTVDAVQTFSDSVVYQSAILFVVSPFGLL